MLSLYKYNIVFFIFDLSLKVLLQILMKTFTSYELKGQNNLQAIRIERNLNLYNIILLQYLGLPLRR